MIKSSLKFCLFFALVCIFISLFTTENIAPIQTNHLSTAISPAKDAGYLNSKLTELINNGCQESPVICETGEKVFYSLGTHIRDGLRGLYLFFDKHFTNQPIEPANVSY